MEQPVKKTLREKILDFQNNVDVIKKNATNPHFKSQYADLPHVLESVKPILNAMQVILTQPIINNEVFTVITDVETGEEMRSGMPIPQGLSAQQAGSAVTYYRRYTLCSLLALEIDEDDDGNSASAQPQEPQKEWLNKWADKSQTKTTQAWDKVVAALTNKKRSVADVEKHYKLSKALKEELQKL